MFVKLYNIYNNFLQKRRYLKKENGINLERKPDIFKCLRTNVYGECTKNHIVRYS